MALPQPGELGRRIDQMPPSEGPIHPHLENALFSPLVNGADQSRITASMLGMKTKRIEGLTPVTSIGPHEMSSINFRPDLSIREARAGVHQPGEIVVVAGIPRITKKGILEIDVQDKDGVPTDKMVIGRVPDSVREEIERFDNMVVGAAMRIGERQSKRAQGRNIYKANLFDTLALPLVNPSEYDLSVLPFGARFAVEGTVDTIEESRHGGEVRTYTLIPADGSDNMDVQSSQLYGITYRGGFHPNIKGDKVQIGDVIRVTGFVEEPAMVGQTLPTYPSHIIDVKQSHALLVEPSTDRLESDLEIRANVASELRIIDVLLDRANELYDQGMLSGNFALARQHVASVRKMGLTESERRRLDANVRGFPSGDGNTRRLSRDTSEAGRAILDQRPALAKSSEGKRAVGVLDTTYGVLTESFTRSELGEFALDVAAGRRQPTEKNHVSQAVALVKDVYGDNGQEKAHDILKQAVASRIAQLMETPDLKASYEPHKKALFKAVEELGNLDTPEAAESLFGVIEFCMDPGDQRERGRPYYIRPDETSGIRIPDKVRGLLSVSTGALSHFLESHPEASDILLDGEHNGLAKVTEWKDELVAERHGPRTSMRNIMRSLNAFQKGKESVQKPSNS